MKFISAAVVLSAIATEVSAFSYLESLSKPVANGAERSFTSFAPAQPAQPEPSTDGAAFFVTNGASDVAVQQTTGSYLDNLSTNTATIESLSPAAGSTGSYLDALASTSVSISAPTGGAGLSSYLDSLPKQPSVAGAGFSSFADSIGKSAAAPAAKAAPVAAAAPAAPVSDISSSSAPAAPTTGSYLETLAVNSAASGAGLVGYLDALPKSVAAIGGAGIISYADSLKVMSTASGSGVPSYTDLLSGQTSNSAPAKASSGKKSTPVKSAAQAVDSKFSITLDVDDYVIQQLLQNGGINVQFQGTVRAANVN